MRTLPPHFRTLMPLMQIYIHGIEQDFLWMIYKHYDKNFSARKANCLDRLWSAIVKNKQTLLSLVLACGWSDSSEAHPSLLTDTMCPWKASALLWLLHVVSEQLCSLVYSRLCYSVQTFSKACLFLDSPICLLLDDIKSLCSWSTAAFFNSQIE